MANNNVKKFAEDLYKAERNRIQIPPLTDADPTLTVDDAYAIQLLNVKRVIDMRHVISGKKIGLTSLGMQKQLGVNEPDYGHLFEVMESINGEINYDELIQPKIEAEMAFVLKKDLKGGNVTVENVINATDYVVAAFEIVDSRVRDWKIKLIDTVADNASSGRYILGCKKIKLQDIYVINETMKMYKNGEEIGDGIASAVLGNPCVAVAWLANRLWGYGVTLNAGEVILSGAFAAAPAASKGDHFMAEFKNLGKVEAKFL